MHGDRWMRVAYSYLYIRDFQKAKEAFVQAIETNPENAAYRFHASLTAFRNRDYDHALLLAQDAVRLEDENDFYQQHLRMVEAAILTERANESWAHGDMRSAGRLFAQAFLLDPLNQEAEKGYQATVGDRSDENDTVRDDKEDS